MAELMRRRQLAERDLDAARKAGDEEAFLDNFKRIAIINEQIEFRPHLVDRWVDEVRLRMLSETGWRSCTDCRRNA
jgi:hypothetical protein